MSVPEIEVSDVNELVMKLYEVAKKYPDSFEGLARSSYPSMVQVKYKDESGESYVMFKNATR